ncbi:MAG: hypothetical protein H0T62_11850 [Parachlamydiaceae bacterium]|nr:hypothetical protein [Parachlamydiaceae bacterium]
MIHFNNNLTSFIRSSDAMDEQTLTCQPEEQLTLIKSIVDLGESHCPLKAQDLLNCYRAFSSEDLSGSKKTIKGEIDENKLQLYLVELEKSFPQDPRYNTIAFVEHLADQLIKFSNEKFFPLYNGRIEHMIAAYLLARAGYPIFNLDTPTPCPYTFSEAQKSLSRMCWFIAELVKSQVGDEKGNILKVQKHYQFSSDYSSTEERSPSNITVHWHGLNKAITNWAVRSKTEVI